MTTNSEALTTDLLETCRVAVDWIKEEPFDLGKLRRVIFSGSIIICVSQDSVTVVDLNDFAAGYSINLEDRKKLDTNGEI